MGVSLWQQYEYIILMSSFIPAFPPDSDGVGRTGVFICLHAQLERLKTEGVVDCFQFIKSARLNRPGLVQNVVSVCICAFGGEEHGK